MEFILVTGLSGSGKSKAVDALEDIGFFCVDNMPPSLIEKFYRLCTDEHMEKVAVVTDARGGYLFQGLVGALSALTAQKLPYKILFLECSDEVIYNRFQETRRRHPLQNECGGSMTAAVQRERALLEPLRGEADYVIDTTGISPAQLKERVSELFLGDAIRGMSIQCLSFGFKYGTPSEADMVLDVRCLPNPFYVEALRPLTGLQQEVADYVLGQEETQGFLMRLYELVDYLVPLYAEEGKSSLVVAVGCTGGRHRSVAIAETLCRHLNEREWKAAALHRDIAKVRPA